MISPSPLLSPIARAAIEKASAAETARLDAVQAAAYMRCSPRTVRRLAAARQIPFTRVGRQNVFAVADLENYLNSRRVEASQ